jgi:hypothetical protein
MNNDACDFKDKGLGNLIKALSQDMPTARVGILGSSKPRTQVYTTELVTDTGKIKKKKMKAESELTNADIGLEHEYGTEGKPMRSFLRFPIINKMQKYLNESGFFGKESLKLVMNEKNFLVWLKKIGIIGENIVSDAFETGGFGTWKPSNMANKKVQQTLVETQQLRDSITSEVK